MTAEETIKDIGDKIRAVIDPILDRDFKTISVAERDMFWTKTYGSFQQWAYFMGRHIVPKRDDIMRVFRGEYTTLPTMIPGISLANIEPEAVQQVVGYLAIYLKLYDWLLEQKCPTN